MIKRREAIGLDVGAQSIKMVRLARNKNTVEILDYKVREIQQGEVKADAIKEVLKNNVSFRSKIPIIASVEGSSVFLRVFKLPGVTKSKLTKIVAYEAQQQVPFPIEEVIWTYQCLRRVSPEETDVVLAAIRTNVIRDFLGSAGVEFADVNIPVVGLNNFLSWAKYEDIYDPSGQAVMVLDLGAKTTDVIIVEKQNLWFRTIPIGGEVITQAVSAEYGINYSEAELLKRDKGIILLEGEEEINSEHRRMSTCIIKSLTRLTSEIARSIEVYSSNFNSLGPRKIFIIGGGSKLKNIGDFFSKKFRIDVYNLHIDKKLAMADNLNKEEFFQGEERFGTALGLALQGLGFGISKRISGWVKLSLLPKEMLQKYKWHIRQGYVAAISGLLVFLGVCFSGYNMQMVHIYRANIDRLENEKKALDFYKKEIMNMQKELDNVCYRMDKFNEVRSARAFWLEMLLGLERLMPNNVWLVGIEPFKKGEKSKEQKEVKTEYTDYSSGVIDLKIIGKTTGTYQDIMTFAEALDNAKYFVRGTSQVVSANPPVDNVRDFLIQVRANPVRD